LDLIRCPIPGTRSPCFFIHSTYSSGALLSSTAAWKRRAASSIAPPKRGPMVSSPETSEDTRSLPAREVTIALCAPETHGLVFVFCFFRFCDAGAFRLTLVVSSRGRGTERRGERKSQKWRKGQCVSEQTENLAGPAFVFFNPRVQKNEERHLHFRSRASPPALFPFPSSSSSTKDRPKKRRNKTRRRGKRKKKSYQRTPSAFLQA